MRCEGYLSFLSNGRPHRCSRKGAVHRGVFWLCRQHAYSVDLHGAGLLRRWVEYWAMTEGYAPTDSANVTLHRVVTQTTASVSD